MEEQTKKNIWLILSVDRRGWCATCYIIVLIEVFASHDLHTGDERERGREKKSRENEEEEKWEEGNVLWKGVFWQSST